MIRDSRQIEIVYRERITARGPEVFVKSPNGHNRIKMFMEPLDKTTMTLIRDAEVQGNQDVTERTRILSEKAGWNPKEARRIWDVHNESVFINGTYGLQRLDRIKSYACGAFREWLSWGPLCNEPVDGVKCTFIDATVHGDPAHTGFDEIKGMMNSGLSLCFMSAKPCLFEPIYHADITIPADMAHLIRTILLEHRGLIVSEDNGESATIIKCNLPAAEEVSTAESIRKKCMGEVTYSWAFVAFEPVPLDLQVETIRAIRQRKGLPQFFA